jgi:hypothetical protein
LVCAACTPRGQRNPPVMWDKKSGTFIWSSGKVRLPPGFTYQTDRGTDTFEGHFTSKVGHVIVRHDIGPYAGTFASPYRSLSFQETVVDGFRVFKATRDWPDGDGGRTVLVAVTFPEAGCANFFLTSTEPADASVIEQLANTFQPRGHPQWACSGWKP